MRSERRAGMGLLELLVAAALAAVVLAAVTGAYFVVMGAIGRQSARQPALDAAAALDHLARDLLCTAVPWGATNAAFVLQAPGDDPHEIECRMVAALPSAAGLRACRLHEVVYHVRRAGPGSGLELARGCRPWPVRDANDSLALDTVWGRFEGVSWELYDGEGWTNRWHPDDAMALPHAARVIITPAAGASGLHLEIPLPAANHPVFPTEPSRE